MKTIELLAPAKNYKTGIIAVNHGADSIYIGAEKFGARESASNSIQEIEKLIKYAHQYHVKVYLTLNTLLFDSEIPAAINIANDAYYAGIDAIIIQDFGLIEAGLPPIPIHASTQMHNFDIEKIKFLESCGFSRVVLPREFSLNQIYKISSNTNIELEFFIHGALCVSLSGQCYLSSYIGGRSANRGNCAQACRLPFDLLDKNKKTIIKNKHLLSLKDLRNDVNIDELIFAGITSFKIEGRLKNESYVANNVAHYRTAIDSFLNKNTDYNKSSSGSVELNFTPDPEKSFNRSFTDLNVKGRQKNIASLDSPKSVGKQLGKISLVAKNFIEISTEQSITNGDGLFYINTKGESKGFLVNKVDGNKIFLNNADDLYLGLTICRNKDVEFEKILNSNSSTRKINVKIKLLLNDGIELSADDEDNISVKIYKESYKEEAVNREKSWQSISRQLKKSGETIFNITDIELIGQKIPFLKIAEINNLRRELLEKLLEKRIECLPARIAIQTNETYNFPEKVSLPYHNISNKYAATFLSKRGLQIAEYAPELSGNFSDIALMTSHYCIKHQFNDCPHNQKNIKSSISEPMYIKHENEIFQLKFDCKNCLMKLYKLKTRNK